MTDGEGELLPKDGFSLWQYGGSLGGPIVKDRAFFYFNYERLQESSEQPVSRAVPSDSFRDGILA